MASAPWQEWEGRILDGSFPLLRYLGGDECSAVFLTKYGEPEPRDAAIKLVRADSSDPEAQSRWGRAAQLSHPHLIRLLQQGSCEADQIKLEYVVMEYAQEELATVLRERPLTSHEARDILEFVLDVLAYLHGKGFAHGHLKPANIMAVDDRLKISCDGIRKTGELPSKPRGAEVYDPPELLERGFSPAGDMWSLGITLVEALTQRPSGAAAANQKLRLSLPGTFREIVASCLQTDPLQRPSVDDLRERLSKPLLAPAEPTPAKPAKPPTASVKWSYAAPAAVFGLVIMFAGIVAIQRRPERPVSTAPSSTAPSSPVQQPKAPEGPQQRTPVLDATVRPLQTGSADRVASTGSPAKAASLPPKPAVKSGTQSRSGQVIHQVLPDVPGKARETIHGTVRLSVRAQVDASGRVARAELASRGPSSYFADLSLRAARQWAFEPAKVQDQDVPSEWLLKFEITRGGTKVHPVRVSP